MPKKRRKRGWPSDAEINAAWTDCSNTVEQLMHWLNEHDIGRGEGKIALLMLLAADLAERKGEDYNDEIDTMADFMKYLIRHHLLPPLH